MASSTANSSGIFNSDGEQTTMSMPAAAPKRRPPPSKAFQCRGYGECRMVFSRSEHLARHVRKHTGEKPFTCHCGKMFSRLDNLRQHAQTVHSDKPELNECMMRELTKVHANMAEKTRGERSKGSRNFTRRPLTSTGYEGVEDAGGRNPICGETSSYHHMELDVKLSNANANSNGLYYENSPSHSNDGFNRVHSYHTYNSRSALNSPVTSSFSSSSYQPSPRALRCSSSTLALESSSGSPVQEPYGPNPGFGVEKFAAKYDGSEGVNIAPYPLTSTSPVMEEMPVEQHQQDRSHLSRASHPNLTIRLPPPLYVHSYSQLYSPPLSTPPLLTPSTSSEVGSGAGGRGAEYFSVQQHSMHPLTHTHRSSSLPTTPFESDSNLDGCHRSQSQRQNAHLGRGPYLSSVTWVMPAQRPAVPGNGEEYWG